MRTIKLLVTIEAPDDYIMDDPEWTLEECYLERDPNGVCVTGVRVIKDQNSEEC